MDSSTNALHNIVKMDMKSEGSIRNNNVAQAPLVSEDEMTKSQVGGSATAKLREALSFPAHLSDQMSGNLMAK